MAIGSYIGNDGKIRDIVGIAPLDPDTGLPSTNLFRNIATATTTQVKTGAGFLHLVNIGVKGTVASTITIYDGLSAAGAKIGIIDSLNLSGAFLLDVAFATGLCIVSTGTVAPDFTVSYR